MDTESLLNIILIGFGLIAIASAFLNWAWLFRRQRSAGFIRLLDHNGARVFNFMLGAMLILIGSFDYLFPLIK